MTPSQAAVVKAAVECVKQAGEPSLGSPKLYRKLFDAVTALQSAPQPDDNARLCECPLCGRQHWHLQAGTPPKAIVGKSLLRPAETFKAAPITQPDPAAARERLIRGLVRTRDDLDDSSQAIIDWLLRPENCADLMACLGETR